MGLQDRVLKLNSKWRAIDDNMNAATAFEDLCRGAIMAIDTDTMTAHGWEDWIKLPVREGDPWVGTARGRVRVPRVVLCVRYEGMPKKKLKLNRTGVGKRDGHRCIVSGDYCPKDGTLDHMLPRSRGGRDTWENLAWMRKDLNHKKGSKTLDEMGWQARFKPSAPPAIDAVLTIRPLHPEWELFLHKKSSP